VGSIVSRNRSGKNITTAILFSEVESINDKTRTLIN